MLKVFGDLRQQLAEAVNGLDSDAGQQFNVAFFNEDGVAAAFKDAMQPATPDNKKKAVDFMQTQITSSPHKLLPAVKFALKQKPEVIYLLTDAAGSGSDGADAAKAISAANRNGKMRVDCIYIQSDMNDAQSEKILRKIALDNHGTFKRMAEPDALK
jgi:hypothetical protein